MSHGTKDEPLKDIRVIFKGTRELTDPDEARSRNPEAEIEGEMKKVIEDRHRSREYAGFGVRVWWVRWREILKQGLHHQHI